MAGQQVSKVRLSRQHLGGRPTKTKLSSAPADAGCELRLISSVALARTRKALHNDFAHLGEGRWLDAGAGYWRSVQAEASRCATASCWRGCAPPSSCSPARISTTIRATTRPPASPRCASDATCSTTQPSIAGSAGGTPSAAAACATHARIRGWPGRGWLVENAVTSSLSGLPVTHRLDAAIGNEVVGDRSVRRCKGAQHSPYARQYITPGADAQLAVDDTDENICRAIASSSPRRARARPVAARACRSWLRMSPRRWR